MNGVCFVVIYSNTILFSIVPQLENTEMQTFVKILALIQATYSVQGFEIVVVEADNTFTSMQ